MSKKSNDPMSEDELLSALGFSTEPEEKKSEPAVINGDILLDMLAPASKGSRKPKASSERERAREEQERERSLRSKEWKRELEQQQKRAAAQASAAEEEELAEQVMRVKAQPIIPNSSDMRDIEDVATMADEKRRAADEVERRRLAMQAEVRRRQEEVAAEAQAAAERARLRALEQEEARQTAAEQLAAKQRAQSKQSRMPEASKTDDVPQRTQMPDQPARGGFQQSRGAQPSTPEPRASRSISQPTRGASQPTRGASQPTRGASQPSRPASRQAPASGIQASLRGQGAPEERMRPRSQGFSQGLSGSAPMQRPERSEMDAPMGNSQRLGRQDGMMAPQQPQPFQQSAPMPIERPRQQADMQQRREAPNSPHAKESPLGVVLIVLAVLCVLVAASLLTGLWDISNL